MDPRLARRAVAAALVVGIAADILFDRTALGISVPIATAAGKIAGFGARAIVAEDTPKYLNSPETAVFRKGRILYGLPNARAGRR